MAPTAARFLLALGAGIVLAGELATRLGHGAAAPVELPQFTDPPPGPRAPRSDGFGVIVGRTALAEVESAAQRRNLDCKDTSARALIQGMREAKKKEREEKIARGETVDATSGASSKKRSSGSSAMEKNPQVRLSCEGTHSALLDDRPRPPATGRLLYIFDSPAHPLRHVSYRRLHADGARAHADASSALAAMTALYGPPTSTSGALPAKPEDPWEAYAPFKAEWRWADLTVTVSALSFGARGIDVYEAVEIPWPVRAGH